MIRHRLTQLFYILTVTFVRVVKFIERYVLVLLSPFVKFIFTKVTKDCGVILNGNDPWDVQVFNPKFYNLVANKGAEGFCQAFVNEWIHCDQPDETLFRLIRHYGFKYYYHPLNRLLNFLEYKLFNIQSIEKSFEVGESHYDLGNDLFEACLGPTMNYSAAYWKNANTLEEAQINKMELVAQKLMLKPRMKVLDIGCGWGTMAKYLAEKYQVSVVGITVSVEGADYAKKICDNLDVDIRVQDYRELNEEFDRIYSIEMLMHVGPKNYRKYFEVVNRCLTDDGVFVLHCLGVDDPCVPLCDASFSGNFMKNAQIPYFIEVMRGFEGLFVIEDWQNIGPDFDRTAMEWLKNFKRNWPQLSGKYDARFCRYWLFYLATIAAVFRSRKFHIWHFILSRKGLIGGVDYFR